PRPQTSLPTARSLIPITRGREPPPRRQSGAMPDAGREPARGTSKGSLRELSIQLLAALDQLLRELLEPFGHLAIVEMLHPGTNDHGAGLRMHRDVYLVA